MENNFDAQELFDKNDKYLKITNIILVIVTVLIMAGSLCGGLIITILISAAGLGLLFGGIIMAALIYIFGRLIFSYLFDVKLIRNKLYETGIEQLTDFYGLNNTEETADEETPAEH